MHGYYDFVSKEGWKVKHYNKASMFKQSMNKIKLFFSLPAAIMSVIFLGLTVLMGIVSFRLHVRGHEWLPEMLISCSCGLATGFAFYFLSNLRANSYLNIKIEYDRMKAAYDYVCQQQRDVLFFQKYQIINEENEDFWPFINRITYSLSTVENLVEELPEHVFFGLLDYENTYPVSKESEERIIKISAEIEDENDEEAIAELCNALLNEYKKLITWLKPAKMTIDERYKGITEFSI